MSHWASNRKLSYIGAFFVLVFIGIALPIFFTVYEAPTCFDLKQNQKELGVDCGGPCSILCINQALSPIILWQRAFKVTPGVYNAVAFIENPNLDSSTNDLPYVFKLYDDKGILIYERKGKTDIPQNKIFPIFESRIATGTQIPSRVTFEFSRLPVWEIDTNEPPQVKVASQTLDESGQFPQLKATIENRSSTTLQGVEVVALVYDSNGNAQAVSRTFIDTLDKNSSQDVVFTWPSSIDFGEGICEKPSDVMIVLDRSGSMDDDGLSPPEPLTSVKTAAGLFVDNLQENDRAGAVSFATGVRDPIDSILSPDFVGLKKTISEISIATDSPQSTNIGEGIQSALVELLSPRHRIEAKSSVVLLTDGIPSHPQKLDDPEYPKEYALSRAEEAKAENIELYIIGLGKNVDSAYLKTLASRPELYFEATQKEQLAKIYQNIATSICKKGPTKIQVIPLTH
ncbi:MAG: vWA domain-containing protein [Candidatus Taylorbacteria bacterium]